MIERTCKGLANEIIAGLRRANDLVYVEYNERLDDDEVAAIVAGHMDDLWGSQLADLEADRQHESITAIINDHGQDVIRAWEREDDTDHSGLWQQFQDGEEHRRVWEEIQGRDTGNWLLQLIRQTPDVLLRVRVLDEDQGYAFTDVTPEQVLADVGLPATAGNLATMASTLNECAPEHSVLLGYWIIGADVEAIYTLPDVPDTVIEIINPYLYLGNPLAGTGFISPGPFEGTITVRRDDLCTDRAAFGYSVDEIYGGLSPSTFTAAIRPQATSGAHKGLHEEVAATVAD
jgi:hypothetical protein